MKGRKYMDFSKHLIPVTEENCFKERGYYVWCGSLAKQSDTYYLFYSRWPRKSGMSSWVTQSEICIASSKSPTGPFKHEKVLFTKQDTDSWDRDCFHNPCVIEHEGEYYLYYMGNYGKGDFWSHRNHQRIGVAWTTNGDILGAWQRAEKPVLDVSEAGFDNLMTSNPTVCKTPDNKFIMMYKGVSDDGKMPAGGAVVCGTAIADSPKGPFKKTGTPLFINPETNWSVEDPCIFYYEDKFYCLVKDFQGYFTKTGESSTALFASENGLTDYKADEEHPLAFPREIKWADGKVQKVSKLERPQVYFENGKPRVLCCAVAADEEWNDTFNLQIPLDF